MHNKIFKFSTANKIITEIIEFMQNLGMKKWTITTPVIKKYLSRLYTYNLSLKLNNQMFEVIYESPLDKLSTDEADVVVFDKRTGWCCLMAIEFCNREEISDTILIAQGLMEKYSLSEFFVYERESAKWYNIKKSPLGYSISSNSKFMDIDLNRMGVEKFV